MTERMFADWEKAKRQATAKIESEKVKVPNESTDQIRRTLQRMEAEYTSLSTTRKSMIERARGQLIPKAVEAMEQDYRIWDADYQKAIERVRGQLRIREDYEKEQAEATRQQRKLHAAGEREEFKTRAQRVFLENGGDPDDFEKAFPELWNAELSRRVEGDLRTNNSQYAREIRGLFSGPGNSGQSGNG